METIEPGAVVTLARNHAFVGEVLAVAPNGTVFLRVLSWGGEKGGWRLRMALQHACYRVDELELAELGDRFGDRE